ARLSRHAGGSGGHIAVAHAPLFAELEAEIAFAVGVAFKMPVAAAHTLDGCRIGQFAAVVHSYLAGKKQRHWRQSVGIADRRRNVGAGQGPGIADRRPAAASVSGTAATCWPPLRLQGNAKN